MFFFFCLSANIFGQGTILLSHLKRPLSYWVQMNKDWKYTTTLISSVSTISFYCSRMTCSVFFFAMAHSEETQWIKLLRGRKWTFFFCSLKVLLGSDECCYLRLWAPFFFHFFLKYLTDKFRKRFDWALNNAEWQSCSKSQSESDGIGSFTDKFWALLARQQKTLG